MERWKQIEEFPMYEVSTKGQIRNIKTGRILRTYTDPRGYQVVNLTKNGKQKTVRIHTVMLTTFHGRHYDEDIATYLDGDKTNLDIDNLDWSRQYDIKRREHIRHSLTGKYNNKVIRVLETGEEFESIAEASRILGLSKSSISKCLNYPYYTNRMGYHFVEVDH